MRTLLATLAVAMLATSAAADDPIVEAAKARADGATFHFDVTVRHPDTGWDHYADGWSVLAPDGTELGHRKLLHPHETEQPFTRSLSGVTVPAGLTTVIIRVHDNVHGWGRGFELPLPGR